MLFRRFTEAALALSKLQQSQLDIEWESRVMRVTELSNTELRRAIFETVRDLRALVANLESFGGATRVFALGTSAGLASYAQSLETEAQRRQDKTKARAPRTRVVYP